MVVIRYEGPKGGPGMREMLNPTAVITGMGLEQNPLPSDRRPVLRCHPGCLHRPYFSGSPGRRQHRPWWKKEISSTSISPNRTLNVRVSDEELAKRREKWVCPAPKVKKGYLARYSYLVSSAAQGCCAEIQLKQSLVSSH